MANVHLFLLLALVTFHGFYQIVDAVACAKDSDCVSTDNVLAKCTSGLCKCKSGFYPITTGCGTQLPKPTVSFVDNYSEMNSYHPSLRDVLDSSTTEAYNKAAVALMCLPPELSVDCRYIWSENGKIVAGVTGPIYQLTADINKNNVAYSCRVTLPDAPDSLESNTFQITVLSTNAAPSRTPRITANYDTVPGSSVKLTCTDIPIGSLVSDIVFKDGNTKIDFYSYKILATSEITCEYKGKMSTALELVKDDFPKPTCTAHYYDQPETVFTGQGMTVAKGAIVILRCRNKVSWKYEGYIKDYYYKDNAVITEGVDDDGYTVDTSTLGETVYACSGQIIDDDDYKLKETKSNTFTIIVQEIEPVPEPFIALEPDVGNIGGHVSLKCLTNAIGDVRYEWSMKTKKIYGQFDQTIQLHNVQLSTDYYSCAVFQYDQYSISNRIYAAKLPQPTLAVTGATDLSKLTRGDTFPLVCQLAAAPKGINYRFYKGTKRIKGRLLSVTKENNGRYTCATFFRNVELSRSKELVISVGGVQI